MMDKSSFSKLVYRRFEERQKEKRMHRALAIRYCAFAFAFILVGSAALAAIFIPNVTCSDGDPSMSEEFYDKIFGNTESSESIIMKPPTEDGGTLYVEKTDATCAPMIEIFVFGDEIAEMSVIPKSGDEAEKIYAKAEAEGEWIFHSVRCGDELLGFYIFSVKGTADIDLFEGDCIINVFPGEEKNLYIISFSKSTNIYFEGGNS